MGIGFPNRPLRTAFGDKLEDSRPVENPKQEVGKAAFNAAFWNTAGLGLVLPRWVVIASWNGSQLVVQHQAEAWNPNNDQAHPVLARSATGKYSYTFASSYLDEDGVAVPTTIFRPGGHVERVIAAATDRTDLYAWVTGSPPVANFWIYDDAGTLRDDPFALFGW